MKHGHPWPQAGKMPALLEVIIKSYGYPVFTAVLAMCGIMWKAKFRGGRAGYYGVWAWGG
jgi:hypothetical protein